MLIGTFHTQGDQWILPHKLKVLSSFCDLIYVIVDEAQESVDICKRFPRVIVRQWERSDYVPRLVSGHRACEEGAMRQAAWDWCVANGATTVLLGDTDEIPTPDVEAFVAGLRRSRSAVECWYAHWVNLIQGAGTAIGGTRSPWSFEKPGTNKKGLLVRVVKGKPYRYRQANVHVRMEPSPLSESSTQFDAVHKLGSVRSIHYKWANWERWQDDPASKLPQWTPWPPADAKRTKVPRSWLWINSSEELLSRLPEPIAVIGNGPVRQPSGKLIDSFPTVIRLNNWRTEGFEELVGTKTDVWCTNVWDDVDVRRPWTKPMFSVCTDDEQYDRHSRWLGCYPHMALPRRSWVEAARKFKQNNPSTGLVLLCELSTMQKRTAAFGFTGLSQGHLWDPSHVHNHAPEDEALALLAEQGIVFN